MNVIVLPANDACGLYRLREPARVLAAAGYNVEVVESTRWQVMLRDWVDEHGNVVKTTTDGLKNPPDADVVVLQRPYHAQRVMLIAALQASGIAVVVELDDDFKGLPRWHPTYDEADPYTHEVFDFLGRRVGWRRDTRRQASIGWHQLIAACNQADLVTVSTRALAERYAPHGRVAVLPNYVPAAYLDIPRPPPSDPPLIGWTGTTFVHGGDLEAAHGVIGQVVAETGARFHHVGVHHDNAGPGVAERLGLDPAAMTSLNEWVSLERYPHEYARLDIAVVPLAGTRFNAAKSCLKGMEAASLGIPFVASDRADYRRLHQQTGIGLLAERPHEWHRHLTRLVCDGGYRAELGERWRGIVAERLTYEQHAEEWWAAWTLARANRQASRRRIHSQPARPLPSKHPRRRQRRGKPAWKGPAA